MTLRPPKRMLDALAQARRYSPGAIISRPVGEAIACLPLRDFVRVIGSQEPRPGQQLVLLAKPSEDR
ncbi:MAG TPA: hypothetical protein VK841_11575 [Polyangiaceae bacterium]|jgi:hypothetical protein|nr:hypothetical protein [Polyangiaceae bacterium]